MLHPTNFHTDNFSKDWTSSALPTICTMLTHENQDEMWSPVLCQTKKNEMWSRVSILSAQENAVMWPVNFTITHRLALYLGSICTTSRQIDYYAVNPPVSLETSSYVHTKNSSLNQRTHSFQNTTPKLLLKGSPKSHPPSCCNNIHFLDTQKWITYHKQTNPT